jgi:hypothetical protein
VRLVERALSWLVARAAARPQNDYFWAYTIKSPDGEDYLTRMLLPRLGRWRPMIHHIHRPDRDRHLHNHPWDYSVSIILNGGYVEERLVMDKAGNITGTKVRVLYSPLINVIKKDDFHRIRQVDYGTWTLFIAGKRERDLWTGAWWGFLVDGDLINHVDYIERKVPTQEARP